MATTTITGTINGVNNAALANKWITFRLVQLGTDSVATATVAQSVDSVQTDVGGDFSIGVWNNGDSGKPSVLEITVEGSKAESVIIPTGVATIELWDLIENYQADGSTSEQVPLVSSLFVRKSNNLSDLGSATTARTNLGVAIGTNVQAHSAVLDATTASFTVAEESKLSGIEALAEVNDPTTLLDANIGSTVQAHSAILDATTASFTTAKDTSISTNTANIASNDTDIATSVTNIATNATGIATNVTNINLKAPIAGPTFTGTVNTSATGVDFNAGNLGGELSWNDTEKTLDLVTGADSVTLQLGQEVVMYARNTTGSSISDGEVVMVNGSQGNKPTIALAQADAVANARKTIGVATQVIPNNSNGFITLIGKVRDLVLDDGTYTEGDVVYLSSTIAGGITLIEPDIGVEIGHVLATSNGGNTDGVLNVHINNGSAVHELEQVVDANTAAIALNTAKVTNATHTGDVIGDTALTIATDAVDIPMLSASGTPGATSFLRGDNTWSVPVSGNTAVEYPYTTDFQSGVSQTRDLGVLDNLSGYNGITALTSVYIGGKVLSIGASTFSSCTGLVDAIIPSSVTIIGASAFAGCTSLTGITIPDSATSIGNSAFYNCSNAAFTSINIPDSVTFVGSQAFQNCTGLTSLTIGNSVTSIGNDTFRSCTSLPSTNIPDSVTSIGNDAFRSCTILATVACSVNKSIIDAATTPFLSTASPLTLNVPTGTTGWTAGTGQSIGGNTNVTVNLI